MPDSNDHRHAASTWRGAALLLLVCSAAPAAEALAEKNAEKNAEAHLARVRREIDQGLAERSVTDRLDRYHGYIARLLDTSAGDRTWSDKTGNCRLSWIDQMLRDPRSAPAQTEQFTRRLHAAAMDRDTGLGRVLTLAAARLDVADAKAAATTRDASALASVRRVLSDVDAAVTVALRGLNAESRALLDAALYKVTTAEVKHTHSYSDPNVGRRVSDALERIDRGALRDAGLALARLVDAGLLGRLVQPVEGEATTVEGADGPMDHVADTPHGRIVIGGTGANVYRLDAMADVAVVIDRGGDDRYEEGTLSAARPVLIVLDLGGNDTYRAQRPGTQGGAMLGASLLVDVAGDDRYEALDVAQGSCLGGVGILVDLAGNDVYRGLRRVQGQATCGFGVLLDGDGDDTYHAALYAQGVGGPLGLGLLDDLSGSDHYYAGGLYPDSYDDTPGYAAWSQGVGFGPRGVANGGIGVLLDGDGDDTYECDYFSHAGGYWFALGLARDFGGNDRRLGATRLAYDGSERAEKVFLRWGVGFGCHFALGLLFDDAGDDTYGGDIVGLAFAWDFGVTALCDFDGNDRYITPSSAQGMAAQAGVAILFDARGDDRYESTTVGSASESVTYHPMPDCGGNFGFVIDYGGNDTYAGGLANDAVHESGSPTGFVIDRPAPPDP